MKGSLAKDIVSVAFKEKTAGVRIGRITEITDEGTVLVDFPGNTLQPLPARFAGSMGPKLKRTFEKDGHKVLLLFEDDDPGLPIIVDTISESVGEETPEGPIALKVDEAEDIFINGKRFTFDAKEEIVLRCGKSSITLTRAGKVLIKGAYLLQRSSGVNRIKGASVQIN